MTDSIRPPTVKDIQDSLGHIYSWSRRDPSDAQEHVRYWQEEDGGDFSWLWDADSAFRQGVPRSVEVASGLRYEWPDGSAIVESGVAWDYGIHRDLLDEARARVDALPEIADAYGRSVEGMWPENEPDLGVPPSRYS